MKYDRKIETSLQNILSHVCCAEDYGYYDDVLMVDFANLTGYVSDTEIEDYITSNASNEYTDEDYDEWRSRMTEWRDTFCN